MTIRHWNAVLLLSSLAVTSSCGVSATMERRENKPETNSSAGESAGIAPGSVGLSKAPLEEVPDALRFTYKREQSLNSYRFNKFAPPVIPHDILDNLPITKTQNDCLDCHDSPKKSADGPPQLPVSHFVNHRTGVKTAQMTPARYNCVACHVPQSDAVPLVGNSYKP